MDALWHSLLLHRSLTSDANDNLDLPNGIIMACIAQHSLLPNHSMLFYTIHIWFETTTLYFAHYSSLSFSCIQGWKVKVVPWKIPLGKSLIQPYFIWTECASFIAINNSVWASFIHIFNQRKRFCKHTHVLAEKLKENSDLDMEKPNPPPMKYKNMEEEYVNSAQKINKEAKSEFVEICQDFLKFARYQHQVIF